MSNTLQFKAPWCRELRMMTLLAFAICLGVPVIFLVSIKANYPLIAVSAVVIPPVILIVSAAFAVRGYTVTDDAVLIHRPGWLTRIPLSSLSDVKRDPLAFENSTRVFGNGGAFAFCGWAQSDRLGRFRLYATDPSRSVILRSPEHTVVITPDNPDRFVEEVMRQSRK